MEENGNNTVETHESINKPNSVLNDSGPVSMELCDNEIFIPTNITRSTLSDPTSLQNNRQTRYNKPNIEMQIIKPTDNSKPLLTHAHSVALSGALAGFLSGAIVCPLDVAKTRLQVQTFYYKNPDRQSNSLKYNGIFNTLKRIVSEEGFRGLYNGLVPITLGYFPTWMIYFSVYEYCKKNNNSPYKNIKSEYGSHALSAVTAGLVSSTLTNPIWVVKTRLMLQINQVNKIIVQPIDAPPPKPIPSLSQTRYEGTMDCFRKMYKQEGLRSFYAGLTPTLFGLVHVAIHFPLYEYCKKHIFCNPAIKSKNPESQNKEQFSNLFLSSCFSKMIATAITYPHEIIRTNLQIKDNSAKTLTSVIKYIWSGYGQSSLSGFWNFGNFYKGFGTNLVRTVPASMITLISFEYFKNYLSQFS